MKLLLVLTSLGLLVPSLAIPYDEYILAPKSRILKPVKIHNFNGSVSDPENLLAPSTGGISKFKGEAAAAYDFGINIAGFVTLDIGAVSSADEYIGVTFSESSLWVSNRSCDATADAGKDETLWFHVSKPGQYAAPREKERGGFRYMTLVHNGTGSVEVKAAEVFYTAMPHWEDDAIGNYTGYFNCDGTFTSRLAFSVRGGKEPLTQCRRTSESDMVCRRVHESDLHN